MSRFRDSGIVPTLGGVCALIIVMGIGRFAYTALLPSMMGTDGFGEETAGLMATWNYAGYLAGVLAMRHETPGWRRYGLFTFFLLLSLGTTAAMGLVSTISLLHGIRFVAGLASGACFVLCSSIVLDTLTAINRPVLAGLLYSGVGIGIALGGLGAGVLEMHAGPGMAWIGMAILCIPPAVFSLVALRPAVNAAPALAPRSAQAATGASRRYTLLLVTYFLEGFGYIIGATFLVALIRTGTGSAGLATASWIIAGCAAAASAPLWRQAARRGYRPMLALAFTLQGAGLLLPVLSHSSVAALVAGLLLGGTFMGITLLSLQYGISLSGRPSAHTVALMTALYGVGQIIGPFVAGFSAAGHGFAFAFVLSSASLFLAAGLLVVSTLRSRE